MADRMTRKLVIFTLVLALSVAASAQSSVAERATTAYQSGDYETARSLYESLVSSGVQNGAVYFNLGNTYYELGDLGHALLNYRRAHNLIPRDPDLGTNMALVRARRLDVQGDETGIVESLAVLTAGVLTLTELGWIVFGIWTLWFALLSIAILSRRWREPLRALLVVLGAVTFVGVLLLGSRLYVQSISPPAVVVGSEIHAMSGPGQDYLELFRLHEAAELRLLETNGDWARIALPDGRQGWVPRQALEVI